MSRKSVEYKPQKFLVSVIIPVYNDAVRLERCLQALAQQSYPNYEVIVVDNGSTDADVEQVCKPFSRVRFAREEKAGSYAARNKGLSLAKGEVIAFTDSDCIPAADWLGAGVARVKQTENCGLIAGHVDVFPQNRAHPSLVELYDMMLAFPQERYVANYRYGVTASVVTTRAIFDAVGLFNDTLKSGGDREWGQRVAAAGLCSRLRA